MSLATPRCYLRTLLSMYELNNSKILLKNVTLYISYTIVSRVVNTRLDLEMMFR